MVKTFDVLLDIEKELYNPSSLLFTVSRDDFNTVQLNFAISQDGKVVDLTNKIVELAVKKPSGLTVYQDCEITNALQGLAQIYLSQQAYIEYGIYTAEVYIREGTEIEVTSPFWYQAKASIFNEDTEEAIESIDDLSALQKALFAYDLKPILVESFPTITPEYVGQMAFDTVNEIAYIATDLSSADWQTFGTGEGGGGANDTVLGDGAPTITPIRWGQLYIDRINKNAYISIGATAEDWEQIDNEEFIKHAVTWGEILEKPTTFAPEEHGHEIIEVIGLQNELDSKAELIHRHDWNEIDNKPLTFVPEAHTHAWVEIIDKPLTFAPDNHNHEIGEIDGLQASLDSKADALDLTTKANIADVYTKLETYNKTEVETIVGGAETVVEDNLISNSIDSALSANQGRILDETKADIVHTHLWADITDAPETFSPETHGHLISEVENLQTELDGKANVIHTHVKADITDFAHNHEVAEVNGLRSELDGIQGKFDSKANAVHQHVKLDILDFAHTHDWDEVTGKPTTFAPEAHTHDWAEVTGKPTTFTPSAHTHDWAEVTGKPTTFAPEAHNHEIAEINGLQGALDLKADDTDLAGKADINHNHDSVYLSKNAIWTGTQTEYDAIGSKNATTLYFITG